MVRGVSLSVRITAIISVMVALLLGLVTLVIGLRLSTSIASLVRDENTQIANARSDEMGQLMDKLHSQLDLIATAARIKNGVRKDVEAAFKDFAPKTSVEGGELIFAFPDGSYFTSTGAEGSIADRAYFDAVMKKGQDYVVADAAVSKSLGVPVVVLARAVVGADGQRAGLVAFQMKASVLSDIVKDVKIGAAGYAYIVDKRSLVIAHPNQDFILKPNFLESAKDGWKGLDAVGRAMQTGRAGASVWPSRSRRSTRRGIPFSTCCSSSSRGACSSRSSSPS